MIKKKRDFLRFLSSLYFYVSFSNSSFAGQVKKNCKVLYNPIFLDHLISKDHPEKPERISIALEYLKNSMNQDIIENPGLNRDVELWIRKIHTKQHVKSLKNNDSIAEIVSSAAVKLCLQGIDKIMNNEVKNIFCLTRPPGHHALNTGREEGFCYYNHIAITAKYIQEKFKLKKILIVDWDYHHGNSTEYFFYDDPSVLFFSTHDKNAYPRSGSPQKKGKGKGHGFNINIHLPCNTNDHDIIKVFKNILIPKVNTFKPDFILISAGFDSRINDLLGCFKLTDKGFKKLTQIVMDLAKIHCDNRLLSILEGGYNLEGNASAILSHVNTLNNYN